jgi:hypothetical protein
MFRITIMNTYMDTSKGTEKDTDRDTNTGNDIDKEKETDTDRDTNTEWRDGVWTLKRTRTLTMTGTQILTGQRQRTRHGH